MATAVIPPSAQFSESADHRNEIYNQAMPRMSHLAWRALNVLNLKNSEFAIICIHVDSRWSGWANHIMPNQDWEASRAIGAEPMALATISWVACEFVAKEFPDIAEVALEVPPTGKMKAIVLNDGGCTIYELEPKEFHRT